MKIKNVPKPIILDGDPGHDDAIAWVLAKAIPELEIKAITTVAGNQSLAKVTLNARKIAALIGFHGPIAAGAAHPLTADPVTAGNFHGDSGLDGIELPEPKMEISPLSAPELMAAVLRAADTEITIVATGPLTNVATFLLLYPELKAKIGRIALMGGGIRNGNWTAAAEFNFFEDPEAAAIVFRSGIPITMAGLDITEQAVITPDDIDVIAKIDNAVSRVVTAWLKFFILHHQNLGLPGLLLHDPCALLSLTVPELFEARPAYVEVECTGIYTRGTCVARWRDLFNGKKAVGIEKSVLDGAALSPVDVLVKLDRPAFIREIGALLRTYN